MSDLSIDVVKQWRADRNISQAGLALELGVTQTQISRFERGLSVPDEKLQLIQDGVRRMMNAAKATSAETPLELLQQRHEILMNKLAETQRMSELAAMRSSLDDYMGMGFELTGDEVKVSYQYKDDEDCEVSIVDSDLTDALYEVIMAHADKKIAAFLAQ